MARKPPPADPVASVRTLLEQLNLTTAARRLADLLAQAETAQPAYSAFLHQLLAAEQGARCVTADGGKTGIVGGGIRLGA